MESKWLTSPLGSVVTFQRGFDLPSQKRKPGAVPIVSSSGISGYHSEVGVKGPGVVTGRYGTIGQVFLIEEDYWPLNTTLWVKDFHGNDPQFIAYLLRTIDFHSCSDKSSVPGVNRNDLHQLEVSIPPLTEQKRIAGILGALDDKIELNRKMNETLEQMAKTLFKSWFVDFDPVHAKAAGRQPVGMDKATADLFPDSFVDSELGNVPKGWRVGTLDELVELRTERIAATPAKDGMRYLALEDMPSRSLDVSQFQPGSAVNSSIIKFLEGDILLGAMRPYFHKVGLAFFDGITRSTTMVLTPKKCFLRHFALLHVFSDELIRYATTASIGTTMPYVKWDSLAKYRIIIPTEELLARFDEQAGRLIIMIGNNGNESRLLAEMRDLLIPQLLSGECNA